jgi:hypothetical protein
MKKLMVYLDEDFHEDLKELAHRQKTSMAELVRFAVDEIFGDELDAILGERRLKEDLANPSERISLDDFIRKYNIALPSRAGAASRTRSKKASASRAKSHARSD